MRKRDTLLNDNTHPVPLGDHPRVMRLATGVFQ